MPKDETQPKEGNMLGYNMKELNKLPNTNKTVEEPMTDKLKEWCEQLGIIKEPVTDQIDQWRKQLDAAHEQVEQWKGISDKWRDAAEKYESVATRYKEHLDNAENNCAQLKDHMLRREEEFGQALDVKDKAIADMIVTADKWRCERDNLKMELDDAQEAIETYRKTQDDLTTHMNSVSDEDFALKTKINELETKNKHLRASLDSANQDFENAEEALRNRVQELNCVKQQSEAWRKRVEQLETCNKILADANRELAESENQLKIALHGANEERSALIASNEEIGAKFLRQELKGSIAGALYPDLQKELEELRKERAQLRLSLVQKKEEMKAALELLRKARTDDLTAIVTLKRGLRK